jgi:CubicO group peptidase (beta-lactamase class C family)
MEKNQTISLTGQWKAAIELYPAFFPPRGSLRRRLVALQLLLILAFVPHVFYARELPSGHIDTHRIDSTVEHVLTEWEVPGIAVGIIVKDSVVLSRGYGLRRLGEPESVDSQTLFAIASLTKAFTTACLGMLVEDGRLSWDDRVTDHLPDFQMYDPFVTREMRIRDLLCHRSGLHTFGGDLIWYGTTYGREEVIRRIRHLKPRYGFRERYGYQNIMFLAAGEIIPRLTGISWDAFVRDSVLLPLGMLRTNTSVRHQQNDENVATPHVEHEGRVITVPYRNVDNVGPAASLNSSVDDLLQWIAMWLRDEDKEGITLVRADTRREIFRLHTPRMIGPLGMEEIPTQHFYGAALGWFVFDYQGRHILRHGGGMDGMLSQIVLVPEDDMGFVFLSNSGHTPTMPLTLALLDACLGVEGNDWLEKPLNRRQATREREKESKDLGGGETELPEVPQRPLGDYAGVYRSEMYGDVRVEIEKGALVVRFLPTPSFIGDLRHLHYDTFVVRLRDPVLPEGWVTFVRDEHGRSTELKVVIPNPDFDFTELELHRVGGSR